MTARSLETRIAELAPHWTLLLPEGAGPFPLVAQFHGCGGVKAFQHKWAEAARDAGFAALIVDSFGHRRISRVQAYCSVCIGARLHGKERAGDIYAVMEWARRDPRIVGDKIALAGWSHGGWSILDAMALPPGGPMRRATGLDDLSETPLRGLAGAFLVYPYASFGCIARRLPLRYDVAPLALVGTQDNIVGGQSLARTLRAMRTPGAPIAIEWMQGCTHAFDEGEARDLRVRYDHEQTLRAHRLYADYLAKAFRHA